MHLSSYVEKAALGALMPVSTSRSTTDGLTACRPGWYGAGAEEAPVIPRPETHRQPAGSSGCPPQGLSPHTA